jgi:hypothetical protein
MNMVFKGPRVPSRNFEGLDRFLWCQFIAFFYEFILLMDIIKSFMWVQFFPKSNI